MVRLLYCSCFAVIFYLKELTAQGLDDKDKNPEEAKSDALISGRPLRCYSCRNAEWNDECNREIKICKAKEVCQTETHMKNKVRIIKRCRKSCKRLHQSICNRKGTKCWYCCDTDLCNAEVEYGPIPPPTVAIEECPAQRFGPKGEMGPEGPKGPKGTKGSPGLKGPPGHSFDTEEAILGPPGPKGYEGLPGLRGAAGEDGHPGPAGQPGNFSQDPLGEVGLPGVVGDPGQDGAPGLKGHQGPSGEEGERGEQGPTGTCDCGKIGPRMEAVTFYGRASGVRQLRTEPVSPSVDMDINLGLAYNTSSSKFTAPVTGVYYFSVHVICNGNRIVPIQLYKNEELVTTGDRMEAGSSFYPIGIIQVLLELEEGENVSMKIKPREGGIWSSLQGLLASKSDVTFSGHLVGKTQPG